METLVKVFKALSDETRLKILMIISSKVICQKAYQSIYRFQTQQFLSILKY